MGDDPFAVLGLTPEATLEDLRVARRRIARESHPDLGGDGIRMRAVNAAFEAAAALLHTEPSPEVARADVAEAGFSPAGRAFSDMPSFVIEALPAEAFEALSVVTSWMGEVLVDEPPYLLEVHLDEPTACWCRLELVPDAGASTITLTVAAVPGGATPDVEAVRDLWVEQLNRL